MHPLRRLAQQVEREYQRRVEAANSRTADAFTLEDYARGENGRLHVPELRFMEDTARYIMAMCSRRAGKTSGIAGRYAKRSTAAPNGNRVYIALTKDQARGIMWEPIWKPLCERYRLCGADAHNETRMVTTFPNGSVVRFTGSDDLRHIATELGGALDEACIDESQDQGTAVLTTLTDKILPPALGDRLGSLILCGVVPDVAAGFFWDTWKGGAWSNHNWSMFNNPHMKDPQRIVDDYLAKHPGLTVDSPLVQRDYYGRFVFDPLATAYTYTPSLNGYVPEVPEWLTAVSVPSGRAFAARPRPGIDMFACAIDPGSRDRVSVQVWGWGRSFRGVQHVFDWTSERGARLSWKQIAEVLAIVQARFAPTFWFYDAGSSQNELDTFTADYGVPVIKAANKSDLPGQVRRFNDLLTQGMALIMIGTPLEEDLKSAKWDKDARARGQWKWSPQYHPDPSEAARYALAGYYDSFQAFDSRTPAQRTAEAFHADLDPDLDPNGSQDADALSRALGWDN